MAVILYGMLIFSTILPVLTEVLQMPARTLVLAHRFKSPKVFCITLEIKYFDFISILPL